MGVHQLLQVSFRRLLSLTAVSFLLPPMPAQAANTEAVAMVESVEGRAYMPGEPRRKDLVPQTAILEHSRVFLDDGARVTVRLTGAASRMVLNGPSVYYFSAATIELVSGNPPQPLP
jgi:hypothetical protein